MGSLGAPMNWRDCKTDPPEVADVYGYGGEGKHESRNVLLWFGDGSMFVGNFYQWMEDGEPDAEWGSGWTLAGRDAYDCEPEKWCELPEGPKL